MGDYELQGFFPNEDNKLHAAHLTLRADHEFADGWSGYIQYVGRYDDQDMPQTTEYRAHENGIEAQLDMALREAHHSSVGGTFKWIRVSSDPQDVQSFSFDGEPFDEQWIGLFGLHRWDATERMTLEGQLRGDWYSETETDWSGRATALYGVGHDQEHVLRFSVAKAFRAPLSAYRRGELVRIPVGPGLFALNNVKNRDLDNEKTWSVEAGGTGRIAEGLTYAINGYFQQTKDLIGINLNLPDPLGLGRVFSRFENMGDADTFGAEAELALQRAFGRFSAWYAYNDINLDQTHMSIRGYKPAQHKVGGTVRLFLPYDFTLNTNYRYSTATHPAHPEILKRAGVYHRLDITVGRRFADETIDVQIGVKDVLNTDRDPVFGIGQLTAHETPGRMVFARVQLSI
jgi:outer membrane receptor protein involved in Fe transport